MAGIRERYDGARGADNLRLIHVRIDGNSHEIPQNRAGVNAASSDKEVKEAVAHYLDIDNSRVDKLIIERSENGSMTLRPEAVFGLGF